MSLENIEQLLSEKEKSEKEIEEIKENFSNKKQEAELLEKNELDSILSRYSSVLSIAEKNLENKKKDHDEQQQCLLKAKDELKEAQVSFKSISTAYKNAKIDHEKKFKMIVKTLNSDLSFALKAKEKEIKHQEKKIQAYNKTH